jgi:glutamate decarboxylase
MLKDELDLDGRPNLNLASFVGTYMETHAEQLMFENISKNMSDADEYPAMMQMHARCVSIIAHLWGVQKGERAIGSATTGSSEAIHLGGLAMKRRWQEKRMAEGKDTSKPNIIMGANAQVALEKFARYFEVEARILPVSEKSNFRLDTELVKENIDENTIGVFVILGSTYTGHYEPVEEISNILDAYQEKTGIDIPIHVDAASGGFVAPFTHAKVCLHSHFPFSTSSNIFPGRHKMGLLPPTRKIHQHIRPQIRARLRRRRVDHLAGRILPPQTPSLRTALPRRHRRILHPKLLPSRSTNHRTVLQPNPPRLHRLPQIMENCMSNARLLSKSLEATGWYTCVSDIHRPVGTHSFLGTASQVFSKEDETSADYNPGLPVVAFRFSDEFKKEFPHLKQDTISKLLRAKQYIIPNYPLPPNEDKVEILRVVVRESMSFDLLDRLISDICATTQDLIENDKADLSILSKSKDNSAEKEHSSSGSHPDSKGQGRGGKRPMSEGVHRTVC